MNAQSISARVLLAHGLAPAAPGLPRPSGAAESKAGRHAPAAPGVPAQKDMGGALPGLRASLLALCRSHALPESLVASLHDGDLEGCELLSPEGLVRWLHVLAENERMREGIAPDGWTQASYCHHCGPVRLWSGAPLHVIGCPWCHVRRTGRIVPRPAVTCAACAHQQHQCDTSEAGMQGCAKGHGLHYARELHVCRDWQPAGVQP